MKLTRTGVPAESSMRMELAVLEGGFSQIYLVGIFHCSLDRRFSNQHHPSFYNLIACSLEYKYKHMNPVIAFSVYDLLVTIAHGLTIDGNSWGVVI